MQLKFDATAVIMLAGLLGGVYLYRKGATYMKDATKPAGNALASVTQWLNGSGSVERTPIRFMSNFFVDLDSYQLTPEAYDVLSRNYPLELSKYVNDSRELLPEYRHLVES